VSADQSESESESLSAESASPIAPITAPIDNAAASSISLSQKRRLSATKHAVRKDLVDVPPPVSVKVVRAKFETESATEAALRSELLLLRAKLQREQKERESALAAKRQLELQLSQSHLRGASLEKSLVDAGELEAERQRFTELLKQQSELEATLDAKRLEADTASQRMKQLAELLASQQSTAESREHELADCRACCASLEQSNAELHDRLSELSDIRELYDSALARLRVRDEKIGALEDEIEDLRAELDASQNTVSSLQESDSDMQAACDRMEEQLAAMAAENARLQAELDSEREKHAIEVRQLKAVVDEKAKLEAEKAALEEKLQRESTDSGHLRDVLVTMKTRLDALSKSERELSASTTNAATKISSKEADLKEKLKEKERLERKSRAALAKLEKARELKEIELERLKKAAAESEKSANETRKEIEAQIAVRFADELSAVKKDRDKAHAKVERLEKLLAEVQRQQQAPNGAPPLPPQPLEQATTARSARTRRSPRADKIASPKANSSAKWASKFFVLDDEDAEVLTSRRGK
jgi:chromosome segregation ATPase